MSKNCVDEQLIQRCVDSELTTDQRRLLLQQLDNAPEDWKTLACTYMEEQLFAAAVVDSDERTAARLVPAAEQSAGGKRHWFYHPLTSVALSACAAFLLGLLVNGQINADGDAQIADGGSTTPEVLALASVDSSTESAPETSGRLPGILASDGPAYRVHIESDDDTRNELRVFDDRSLYLDEYAANRRRVLKSFGSGVEIRQSADPKIYFIRLPLGDRRVMVIPIESFLLGPQFQ